MATDTRTDSTAVDFTAYHRPELVESATSLLSVRGSLLAIIRCAAIVVAVSWTAVSYLFLDRVGYILTGAMLIYATIVAVAIGVGWGIARVMHTAAGNVMKIVDVVLELSITAVDDLQSRRDAGAETPEVGDVVRGIHRQVVFPAIEIVIRQQAGILSRPVIWFYALLDRLLIERALRLVASSVEDEPSVETGNDENTESDDSVVGQLADRTLAVASAGARALSAVRETISDWGTAIERRVRLLARIVVIGVATLGAVPLGLVWYWSGCCGGECLRPNGESRSLVPRPRFRGRGVMMLPWVAYSPPAIVSIAANSSAVVGSDKNSM